MNTEIRKLEDSLIQTLNDSPLAIEIKRLIVRDVLQMVEREANNAITCEIEDAKRQAEEQETKEAENAEST